jgi:hypothetical protein
LKVFEAFIPSAGAFVQVKMQWLATVCAVVPLPVSGDSVAPEGTASAVQ